MNKTIGLQLIVYSLLLAGLSYLVYHLAPSIARPTLVAGLTGGVLCLVWGILAIGGSRRKALAILTLVPLSFVMLSQAVLTWGEKTQAIPGRQTVALLITVLFVLSIGMLMRIAYAGVVFDGRSASPTKDAAAKSQSAEKSAGHVNAAKRV